MSHTTPLVSALGGLVASQDAVFGSVTGWSRVGCVSGRRLWVSYRFVAGRLRLRTQAMKLVASQDTELGVLLNNLGSNLRFQYNAISVISVGNTQRFPRLGLTWH